VNAGTAVVTVAAKPESAYRGSTTAHFTIKPLSLAGATVAPISDKSYTGAQVKPSVSKVSLGGKTLQVGVDYTLTYGANKNIGKGTLTVLGKGNYAGTNKLTFNIVPTKTAIKKITVGKKQAKVTWKPVPKEQKVTKYEIRYLQKGKSKWAVKTVAAKKASIAIKKLNKGKAYKFQVRSYKTVSKAKYYSAWSGAKTSKKIK
jgi:hypothetical protein